MIVFREATAIANAYSSARITGNCCYAVGVFFSAVSLNIAFVSAYTETNYSFVINICFNLLCSKANVNTKDRFSNSINRTKTIEKWK